MSNYPAQIDTTLSLPTAIDGQTPVHGIIFNRLRDAVLAIEAELGTKPSSVYTNIKTRLETIEDNLTNVSAINLSGDVIGTFSSTEVTSLYGRPLSSAAPILNQVLGWNGISWSPFTPVFSNIVGGDLIGSLPNPNVSGIRGNPISTIAPIIGQTLIWNGTNWVPSASFTNLQITQNLTVDGYIATPILEVDEITANTIKTGTLIALSDSSNLGIGSVSGTVTVTSGADIQVIAGTKAVVAAPEVEMQTTNLGRIDLNFNGQDRHSFTYSSGSTQAVYSLSPNGKITSSSLAIESSGEISLNAVTTLSLTGTPITFTSAGDVNLTSDGSFFITAGLQVDSSNGTSVSIYSPLGIDITGPTVLHGEGGQFTISVLDNGTAAGDNLILTAGTATIGSAVGGGLSLKAGSGSNFSGNIGFNMNAPAASSANGQLCLYVANTTTAPISNPSGGFALYSSSGVAKIRSGANTVTLGDKPTVTGSRASGDALVSLLSILQTAGIITNGTTA